MIRHIAALLLLAPLAAYAAVPTPAQVREAWRPSAPLLLDRHGEPIDSVRLDMSARRGAWVALADISPAMLAAIVGAEDQRFFEHGGVDLRAAGVAAWDNLFNARSRGASTITMQLASLLDPALRAQKGGRSLGQKWDQALAAREIEAGWSKEQILEAYLNLVPFRGELRGIGAASRQLFRKAPSGLGTSEAAILASLVRSPSAAPRTVARRACALARSIEPVPDCAGIEWDTTVALGRAAAREGPGDAGQVAQRLVRHQHSRAVRSSLDGRLQRFAADALRKRLLPLAQRNVSEGAVVVMDNATGEVLAYVGNAGQVEVDGAAAPRQAGSTLKPFLYGLAIERRLLTAASVLDDSPVAIATPSGAYVPQNYDNEFKGNVTVRTSLGNSLNVPAVRTLLLTGQERFHERLRALGLDTLDEVAGYYGYSLALGSAEVRLVELANAYRTLANGGMAGTPSFVPRKAEPKRRVFGEAAAFIVGDILADRAARSLTFGLENDLATTYWAAVKTGTSKDMRDNWAVGYSTRYTVGVWVGNFDGSPMWDVSGSTGAAPIWRDVMDFLHAGQPPPAPRAPKGVAGVQVEFEPAIEAARHEWFVEGTQARRIALVPRPERAAQILYPADGAILAVDPDIPGSAQRVLFRAQGAGGLYWQLNGRRLEGVGAHHQGWAPEPGRHVLALVDEGGRVVAESRFSVRGSPVVAGEHVVTGTARNDFSRKREPMPSHQLR